MNDAGKRGRCFRTLAAFIFALLATAPFVKAENAEPKPLAKPYLLIEGWLDRDYCSDLYAFDHQGGSRRRLSSDLLPTCQLLGFDARWDRVLFVANASGFYSLSARHNLLHPLYAGNVDVARISPGGDVVAYFTDKSKFNPQPSLRIQHLGGHTATPEAQIPLDVTPREIVFAPQDGKGQHREVLITTWTSGHAQVQAIDLTTGKARPVLAHTSDSFYNTVLMPGGKRILAVREDLDAGQWSIVSAAWPRDDAAGPVDVLYNGPKGVPISTPIPVADGEHIVFYQGGVLGRINADGKTAEGLSGELDQTPRKVIPHGLPDRRIPTRTSWIPIEVSRWFAHSQWEPAGDGKRQTFQLVLIDVQTKEKRVVPMPDRNIQAAVVVE